MFLLLLYEAWGKPDKAAEWRKEARRSEGPGSKLEAVMAVLPGKC
jgi:hypothetical protein